LKGAQLRQEDSKALLAAMGPPNDSCSDDASASWGCGVKAAVHRFGVWLLIADLAVWMAALVLRQVGVLVQEGNSTLQC
jgi:hypothetical protein